ncbi:MAG: hotdog fold thioesterase [Dermatophilaceae bacterium]
MTTIDADLYHKLVADPVAEWLGIDITELHPGYAKAVMEVTSRHLNIAGTAHGGVTMLLIDVVHAAVSNSHGTLAVAQEVHTEFLNGGLEGDHLVCEGTEVNRTKRAAVYRIDVTATRRPEGRPDALIATALARVFRIGTPWIPDAEGDGAARS